MIEPSGHGAAGQSLAGGKAQTRRALTRGKQWHALTEENWRNTNLNGAYRAWTNFEFVADDGSINEVDLLVFTPQGFFLVEIKSRPGVHFNRFILIVITNVTTLGLGL